MTARGCLTRPGAPPARLLGLAFFASAWLAACAHPQASARDGNAAAGISVGDIAEPGAHEVVIIVNDNAAGGNHAGMFAGKRLSDPSGTYRTVRAEDATWAGPTLRDYLGYQLNDGENVRVYRFTLARADFEMIKTRIAEAGWEMPFFCAASVRNKLAGVGPFSHLEATGWTSPTGLGILLDQMLQDPEVAGICEKPNGKPC